jgi:hypothetical protein
MVNLKHKHTCTQSAIIEGLKLNPIYTADGTLQSVRVVAVDGYGKLVPDWAQPTRRRPPNKEEMASMIATPMLPGEVQVPTWLERVAEPYLLAVYGDIINAEGEKT